MSNSIIIALTMNNSLSYKLILISIILSLIVFTLPLIGFDAQLANTIFSLTISIGQILSVMLLLKNGTLLSSPYFKGVLFFMLVLVVSAIYKWIHYTFAQELLLIGATGVVSVYFIFFLIKKPKDLLSILKALWAITAFVGSALIFLKVIPTYSMWVSTFILFIAVGVFYRKDKQSITEK
jgi:hypothetical protein